MSYVLEPNKKGSIEVTAAHGEYLSYDTDFTEPVARKIIHPDLEDAKFPLGTHRQPTIAVQYVWL